MNASERATGYFPLSIATSLALEGALGIHPDHPAGPKLLKDFSGHWVNVKTLFRNYYEAIGKENIPLIDQKDLIDSFRHELESYLEISAEQGQHQFKTVLYCPDYIGLESRLPHAILRVDSTPNQILFAKSLQMVLGQIIKNEKELIKLYPLQITDSQSANTLMLTHYPYDLTTKVFSNLSLLESHTGNIKDKSKWYTKFYNGKDLPMIPFHEGFLSIFGDSQLFRPIGATYRKTLVDLGTKYNWSFATSQDKVNYGLNQIKDKFLAEQLRLYLRRW
ncbi:hypothetical protein [Ralstonia phage RP12]|uniref:Uncharacterized protein n=1 Tax=Ralstonia phage RP12 TaxID=1923889 RepID=A0A1L7N1A9_9CAUD|nr:hypothetical protein FDH28_gp140 [Ralstonia phage RP12]BAW19255.1 hypothetical protein [Ralstonia phage RP12]